MIHRFQCRCGTLQGELAAPARGIRGVCYCHDCRTYAHLLGQPESVLDAWGGTDVVATQSAYVRFTAGASSLACVSLSPRGLLRWYARCCDTPIANTPRDWKLPYAGLVHTCLHRPDPLERSYPRVQARVNTKSAIGTPPRDTGPGGMLRYAGLMLRLLGARAGGRYRQSPFFDSHGAPVVPVAIAPREAVQIARQAAG
jgi:hypothetical protein